MKKLIPFFMFLTIFAYSSAMAGEPLHFKHATDAALLKEVETSLFEFRNLRGPWPIDINTLRSFATKSGSPLDLSLFGRITLEQRSSDTILVVYSMPQPTSYLTAYAITVVDIKPPGTDPRARAPRIKKIQRLLIQNGYDPGPADGGMGNKTKNAIRTFQHDHGLPVTGGPNDEVCNTLEAAHAKRLLKKKLWPNRVSHPQT